MQHTVQSESVCTGDCTAHCTGDCTIDRITLVGVRGGSGTSTIGAALALISRTMVRTELVTADPVLTAALLGVAPPDQLPAEVLPRLVLAQEASGEAELTIIDAGTVTEASVGPRASGERRLGVLRGPCYLALRTLLAGQHGLDGLVLVAEPGRALNERDVADVTGLDVVATVPVTPGIARTIDAGLLAARHQNQREFRDLRRWLTTQLDPFPTRPPPRRATAPTQPEMAGTDLPVALCATGWGNLERSMSSTW